MTLGKPTLHKARKSAFEAMKAEAVRGQRCSPSSAKPHKADARTLREIAEALNARGTATARGGRWYAQSVANILERT